MGTGLVLVELVGSEVRRAPAALRLSADLNPESHVAETDLRRPPEGMRKQAFIGPNEPSKRPQEYLALSSHPDERLLTFAENWNVCAGCKFKHPLPA